MSQAIMVPVTITPDAADFIRELALQDPFEQMLEHAQLTIPGLYSFAVSLLPRYDEDKGAAVIIDATSADPFVKDNDVARQWGRWQIERFPPDVWQHFTLFVYYVPAYAR